MKNLPMMKIQFKSSGVILLDSCQFKDVKIGSIACQECKNNIETSVKNDYVICKKYNAKHIK